MKPTDEQIEDAADEYVFNEADHNRKWSNNDDTAGDNFGSFKAGANWAISQMQPECDWNVIYFTDLNTLPLDFDPVLCWTDDGLQILQMIRYGNDIADWAWETCFSKPVNKSFPIDFVSQWKNVNEPPTK